MLLELSNLYRKITNPLKLLPSLIGDPLTPPPPIHKKPQKDPNPHTHGYHNKYFIFCTLTFNINILLVSDHHPCDNYLEGISLVGEGVPVQGVV